jgi:hypothetical protein
VRAGHTAPYTFAATLYRYLLISWNALGVQVSQHVVEAEPHSVVQPPRMVRRGDVLRGFGALDGGLRHARAPSELLLCWIGAQKRLPLHSATVTAGFPLFTAGLARTGYVLYRVRVATESCTVCTLRVARLLFRTKRRLSRGAHRVLFFFRCPLILGDTPHPVTPKRVNEFTLQGDERDAPQDRHAARLRDGRIQPGDVARQRVHGSA